MSDQAPLTKTLSARVGAQSATTDAASQSIGEAPFAGVVTSATYTPDSAITGADTNTRTISIINKGQSGGGSTAVATLALASGVSAAADDEKALTLSATTANRNVSQGDILAFSSVHAGTGLADPGGLVQVEISRS